MTTAKILAIVAVLVSLPSLALAQTVVIVTSPYADTPSLMPAVMPSRIPADTLSRTTADIPTLSRTPDITPMPPRTMGMRRAIVMAGSAGKDFGQRPAAVLATTAPTSSLQDIIAERNVLLSACAGQSVPHGRT